VQLSTAIQQEQRNQEEETRTRIDNVLRTLPPPEREVYKHKMTDVVQGRQKLNLETGEWMEARRGR
jgi:hypothetical protein